MEDPPTLTPTTPKKRPLEDATLTTPNRPAPSEASTPLSVLSSLKTPSPTKNASSVATAPSSNNNSVIDNAPNTTTSNSISQPAKRRRLTQKEKDDQRIEKEAKAKARADKKAQKEAEEKMKADQKAEQKAQKDEEKRQRDEEKRKKNEEREEKKRQKDLEQQQKEEETKKKERSQMRLNAFFAKPKPGAQDSGHTVVDSSQKFTTNPISLAPDAPVTNTDSAPPSPQKSIRANAHSDYERYFLPFSLPSHAILAPRNAFMEDPAKLAAAQARLDKVIAQEDVCMDPITIEDFKASFSTRGARGLNTLSVVEIVEQVNGSSDNPIDLTDDREADSRQALDVLRQIPMKYIHFGEDVRPPYYGTYTKPCSGMEAKKLARVPLSRSLREANYDYDSEAEWEEPEEGEDLDSEGEEDLDEDGDDDMNDFLDDEDDPQLKRRLISGDLEPVSTGLCWEDPDGVSKLNDGSGAISTEFKDFKMGFLLEPRPHAIDPFSTAYWTPDPPATTSATPTSKNTATNSKMKPPRLPLTQRPINGLLNTLNGPQNPPASTSSKPVKTKRLVPDDQLAEFKAEIEGKDLTKIGMIEALKKTFPKFPKDAISNTLTMVAKRVGPSEKEKRWVLTV